jgi:putative flippase GtrA
MSVIARFLLGDAAQRLRALLLSPASRAGRFVVTGCLAGLGQLAIFEGLLDLGWPALGANVTAFLLAAQLNFALSTLFTWHDRITVRSLWHRWATFHISIAAMAVLNMLVFAAARATVPHLLAAALGICTGAVGNFFIGDRLVFRATGQGRAPRRTRGRLDSAA